MTKLVAAILAGGIGSRSTYYPYLHKALLPLSNKPTISHQIDFLLSRSIKRVYILSNESYSDLNKYVEGSYSVDQVILVKAKSTSARGSGPGTSLLLLHEQLMQPFVALGCDTLGNFDPSHPGDWITTTKNTPPWVSLSNDCEYEVYDSASRVFRRTPISDCLPTPHSAIFTGVIGVDDFSSFWRTAHSNITIHQEPPIHIGFNSTYIATQNMDDWLDTGNPLSYQYSRSLFSENVTPKPNQELFIYNDTVYKFFKDKQISQFVQKRHKILYPYAPVTTPISDHLFSYPYVKGDLLSARSDPHSIAMVVDHIFSTIHGPSPASHEDFIRDCQNIWISKLYDRLFKLSPYQLYLDNISTINHITVPPVQQLLDSINWSEFLFKSIPCLFHGDPSPENVIISNTGSLYLIDPRPSFGESLHIGDVYYDLAKLDHGLLVNPALMRNNRFTYNVTSKSILITLEYINGQLAYREYIYNKLSHTPLLHRSRLQLSTILILLSISTAHTSVRINNILFLYAKYLLALFVCATKSGTDLPINYEVIC